MYFNRQNTYMGQHLKDTKGYLIVKLKAGYSYPIETQFLSLGAIF